ncbi:MAG: flagellar M-ring protein FliF [Candidatus Dadabacteria bacterium]|nr:MAG: flagellar M-ring protein FliF [Candidatus Dadabacteria bacterium]
MAKSLDPSAILAELAEGYIKLPLVQKIVFPLLIIGSVVGIIYVANWANRPDYAVLYSNLEPADAAAVVEALKNQKIKYEVRGDGSTIAISPPSMVHELRLSLASEGIPKGGVVGLEIFDATEFGTTSFQEKIKFIRAIQGELERTISSLEAVQTARVHITQPEKSVFAKRASEATASVMLRLRPGAKLEKKQIKGIANLVAGSVEGLEPSNVTIIDVYGNLLTSVEEEEEELGADATRLQYQQQVERSYVKRIEQMLQKVLGPGKVIARVTAELDFSSNEREEESFDPGGQVIRSERSVEEGTGASQRGGVPGVVSNLGNDANLLAPPGSNPETSSRRESVRNYEVSRAVTRISHPRGTLKRLSVAVLVDGKYVLPEGAPEGAEKEFRPLEPEVMDRIETLVKNAVGFDATRGDTLSVENIPFYLPDEDFADVMDSKATQDLIFNTIFRVGPILFLVLFFFVIVKPLVKFLITPTEAEIDLTRLLPTGIEELEAELEAEKSKAGVPEFEPAIDLDQLEELIAENSRVVKENPQQAALLIRYWLNDGRL